MGYCSIVFKHTGSLLLKSGKGRVYSPGIIDATMTIACKSNQV